MIINFASCLYSCYLLFSSADPKILNGMTLQEIFIGNTSLIFCEVDRGRPFAGTHWARVTYYNESVENISVITPTHFPRFTIVEEGLKISNVQLSDEGKYRILIGSDRLDILAAFKGMSINRRRACAGGLG